MQVIGLCRFSYPALGGFQVGHETAEERMRYLYDPVRMEERLALFEAVALPGLKAQTDPDFQFLILIGDSLPDTYRQRLAALVADFPQARIVERPPENLRDVCKSVINGARDMAQPCLQFRHDDDDALAVSFVARLRKAADDCAGLLQDHRLVGFDFNRGYVARIDAQGIATEACMTPYWGVALAVAVQAGIRQTIMNFGHNKLPRFMPTVTFTDCPMYVRGHNDFNDSRQGHKVKQPALAPLGAQDAVLWRDSFAIDPDTVARVFANV